MKGVRVVTLVVLVVATFAFVVLPSRALPSGIGGTVYWYDQYGNLHPFSWVQVKAVGVGGAVTVTSSTVDGAYMLWVPAGTYNVTASSEPGFIPQSKMVIVTDGSVAGGVDFQLEASGNPVPEYPESLLPIVLLATTAAAVVIIRRRIPQRVA
jgi:hypothetical protein